MFTLVVFSLLAAEPPKVVAPEWKVVNVSPELAGFYANHLATALRAQGMKVVTADDISTLLGMERQKSMLGCAEEAQTCMAELANALGADATLSVSLARFGEKAFRGVANLLSSRNGETLASAVLDADSEEKLLGALDRAAKALAVGYRSGAAGVVQESQPFEVTRLWWLPGALGLAAGATGGVMLGLAGGKLEEMRQIESGDTSQFEHARQLRDDGKTFETVGWVAAGVGVGLIATSVVMLVWPKAPVAPVATVSPAGAQVGIGGSF